MGYWVDVLDTSLAPLGPGPLATVPRVQIVRRLDRAGQMQVRVPAIDPRSALIQQKRILSAKTLRGGAVATVGSCIIDGISVSADAADAPMLDVSGPDLLGELSNRLVGSLTLSAALSGGSASNPATIGAALTAIMALAPAGWTIDTATFGPGTSTIYLELQNETVLAALAKVAAGVGEHFRLGVGRQVVWLYAAQPDSGVRAVMRGEGAALRANPHVCVVTRLEEQRDSSDAVTRIYARGGGNEKAALTLQWATDTPPAGYTRGSDSLGYFLKHDASDTANRIDGMRAFKEIAVSAGTSGARAAAANTLQQATYQELAQHLPTAPVKTYSLAVVGLDVEIRPGDLLRLIYRKMVGSYQAANIDAALVVLETTDELTANGARTIGMTVGTVGRWPQTDTETLVSALNTVQNLDRHLQKVPEATTADTAAAITGSSLTLGSVPFIGASGALIEDNSNLFWDDTNNRLGVGTSAPASPIDINVLDAGTTTQVVTLLGRHRSTGAPGVGFGSTWRFQAETDNHTNANQFGITTTWQTATNGSQKARVQGFVYDTAAREFIRGEASGTAPMIGFLGAAAIARTALPAAATDAATTQTLANAIRTMLINLGLAS